MTDSRQPGIDATPLEQAVLDAFGAPVALLALGIPLCPSCELLKVTLAEIAASRPDLVVRLATMESQDDWDARERLLWPRDIHVSRASIPVMVLVRDGSVVESRHGGGPAAQLDAWLSEHLGAAPSPLAGGFTEDEVAALSGLAATRANLLAAKAARSGLG